MSRECFKVSNNKYFNCPALMSDGRTFTDYRPKCTTNQELIVKNNIKSSYELRQFLIKNASEFMQENNYLNKKKNSCETCNSEPIPLQSVCDIDGYTSMCNLTNPSGLGQGYQASNMPLLNYSPPLQNRIL